MSDSSFAEIAALFQDSLNDLSTNDRWQIGNLTMIAKEHIEAAQEISATLESHIKHTAPSRKLPALYVLDSIVKNTGSPYTIFLGRNLYSIFMDAYTLVDGQTRRAMESMLRTWQKPLTTMDNTPVFPVETTTGIDNALNRARAILQRGQPQAPPYRNTPPPQLYQNGYQSATPPPYGLPGGPQPPNVDLAHSILASLGQQRAGDSISHLQEDIKNLISTAQQEFARNVYDISVQKRLQALLDLQNLVKSQQLPPEIIDMIKAQVAALAADSPRPSSVTPVNQWQQPRPPLSHQAPAPALAPAPAALPFAPGALDALLAATAKPATPTLPPALPMPTMQIPMPTGPLPPVPLPIPMSMPLPLPVSTPTPAPGNASSLIDALRAAGLTPNNAIGQAQPASLPTPTPATSLLRSLQGLPALDPPVAAAKARWLPAHNPDLKLFRPELLSSLYEAQPNQCSTCGRRFPGTEAGRAAKSAHLDWHFRTNQHMAEADADGRAQYRKFYIDEMAWIRLPNFDPSSGVTDGDGDDDGRNGGVTSGADGKGSVAGDGKIEQPWLPVPGVGEGNTTCPICQEPFAASWHDGAQEWVWMDAERVRGTVFHASCHGEVSRGAGAAGRAVAREGVPGGVAPPDSKPVPSGKRKADDVLASLRAKLTKGAA